MYTAFFSAAEHFAGPIRAAREPGQDAVLDATALGPLKDVLQEIPKPRRRCSLRGKRTRKNTGGKHTRQTYTQGKRLQRSYLPHTFTPRGALYLPFFGALQREQSGSMMTQPRFCRYCESGFSPDLDFASVRGEPSVPVKNTSKDVEATSWLYETLYSMASFSSGYCHD